MGGQPYEGSREEDEEGNTSLWVGCTSLSSTCVGYARILGEASSPQEWPG